MKTVKFTAEQLRFSTLTEGKHTLIIGEDCDIFFITTKQKGYGRQGVYADIFIDNQRISDVYIMDVFPNIDEHFNAAHYDDAFPVLETNENGEEVYLKSTDCDGNELDHVYSNTSELFLGKEIEIFVEIQEDEED